MRFSRLSEDARVGASPSHSHYRRVGGSWFEYAFCAYWCVYWCGELEKWDESVWDLARKFGQLGR